MVDMKTAGRLCREAVCVRESGEVDFIRIGDGAVRRFAPAGFAPTSAAVVDGHPACDEGFVIVSDADVVWRIFELRKFGAYEASALPAIRSSCSYATAGDAVVTSMCAASGVSFDVPDLVVGTHGGRLCVFTLGSHPADWGQQARMLTFHHDGAPVTEVACVSGPFPSSRTTEAPAGSSRRGVTRTRYLIVSAAQGGDGAIAQSPFVPKSGPPTPTRFAEGGNCSVNSMAPLSGGRVCVLKEQSLILMYQLSLGTDAIWAGLLTRVVRRYARRTSPLGPPLAASPPGRQQHNSRLLCFFP